MKIILSCCMLMLVTGVLSPCLADQQADMGRRISDLEMKVANLQNKSHAAPVTGGAAFLFGAFCALWAQNTKRSAWGWFFLGLIFSVITVIVLLVKNAEDQKKRESFDINRLREQ